MSAGAPTIGGLKRLSNYLAGQLKSAVSITGGAIDGTTVGATTSSSGRFTTITASGLGALAAGNISMFAESVAAAGSDSTNAGALSASTFVYSIVTGADGAKGVQLSTFTVSGAVHAIYNPGTGTNYLKVYPPAGGTLNGGSANAAITLTNQALAIAISGGASNYGVTYRTVS